MQAVKALPLALNRLTWRRWAAAAGAYLALYSLWLAVRPPGEALHLTAGHLAQLLPGGLAAAAALALRAAPGLAGPVRRAWTYLGLALSLWLTSAGGWTLYRLLAGARPPLPSLVDPLYMAGHLLAGAALLSLALSPRGRLGRFRALLDLAILSGVGLALGWLLLLQPVLTNLLLHPAETLWTAIYPVLDILLLVLISNLLLVFEPAEARPALGLAAAGLTAVVIADLAYTYLGLRGQVDNDAGFDLGRLIGYSLIGLAAQWPARRPLAPPSRPRRWLARLQNTLPLAAGIALAWYTVLDWRTTGQLEPVAAVTTILLGLALVARQGVIAGESELRQYAQLVEGAADPAFICDAQGRLRLANPALAAALGRPREADLIGHSVLELLTPASQPPDLRGTPRGLSRLALEDGWSGEVHLQRADGSALPVYLALRPVPDESGAAPVLAGIAHDLSEQQRQRRAVEALNTQLEAKVEEKTRSLSAAYDQLAAQNEALKTLDQLKSDFVSLVSHELRAPLTNIAGGLELVLGRSQTLEARQRERLTLVQAEVRRLSRFVETILDLSALEAGRLPLTPAPLALAPAAEALRAQLASAPGGDRVRVEVPADLPLLLADERALASVLFHLTDNALKYAPAGAVTLAAEAAGPWVRVSVSDQGPGIPAAQRAAVFERFQRLDAGDARLVYGHGLGLYMVRQLVAALGGAIAVTDAPGGGARFTFELPVAPED